MTSAIATASLHGIHSEPVFVETDIASGLSLFTLVGLADAAIQEARERIRSALRQSGFEFPKTRITVNLAPADQRKSGASFDLPIAIAILLRQGVVTATQTHQALFVGELALDGRVRGIRGALSMALLAKKQGYARIFLPSENLGEAGCLVGIEVVGVPTLRDLVRHLRGEITLDGAAPPFQDCIAPVAEDTDPFAEVHGHGQAKRALEIAAAGGHSTLLHGPPGSGKTLLARRFAALLPNLAEAAAIETTLVHSAAGRAAVTRLITRPPLRAPHHTASLAAFIGGGSPPKPGEISLAHNGILFLDELPEYPRSLLEALRQPLEDRFVHINRAHGSIRFPARCQLVATMNPCPCGFAGSSRGGCKCRPQDIARYQKRLSGPLLDRIDLFVHMDHLSEQELRRPEPAGSPVERRAAVERAQARMYERFAGTDLRQNGDASLQDLRRRLRLSEAAETVLGQAVERYRLSGRGYTRVLRVAATIADLANSDIVDAQHLAEALTFRKKDHF